MQKTRAAAAAQAMAEAALREAQLDVEFTEVRAPITGRISDRRVDIGNLVTGDPSATLLTTIVALDPIHFVFDMSEADYLGFQRAVEEGELSSARDRSTVVQIRLPDEPDTETWPRSGHMDFVDNRIEQSAGTIRARAELANPDHFITPGQFGQLRLPGSPRYEAILIPDSAIVADQADKIVLVVAEDGTVEPRAIREGPRYAGGLRIIRRGLEPTDRIVINGLMRARPGAKVDPQPGSIDPPSPEDAVTQG
jgi:RND family efflux transporter MFP subunit